MKPVKKKQLRSFLGGIGYYHQFIPAFSDLSAILTPGTARLAPDLVHWKEDMTKAFCKLKDKLCKSVVLFVPQDGDITLYTDVSAKGIAEGRRRNLWHSIVCLR